MNNINNINNINNNNNNFKIILIIQNENARSNKNILAKPKLLHKSNFPPLQDTPVKSNIA